VLPYLSAAAATYGSAVLDKVRDETTDAAAEASVGLGRRLLRRLLGQSGSRPRLEEAVQDAAQHPGDEEYAAALKVAVRKVLEADPDLATAVQSDLKQAGVSIAAIGERSIAAQTITGVASTGDNTNIQR
jgi:ribosomal protein S11